MYLVASKHSQAFMRRMTKGPNVLDVDMSRMAKRKAIDARALRKAQGVIAGMRLTNLKTLPKKTRDAHLRDMKRAGLSIRQIERLTGIGRNIIANA